ncbi:hypothetical protein B0T25DRAFT_208526 [Lasiosphaeria hispida]|uniref:Uncharacterized protein n=1 Tax=Lasiosphaeria hispida TaxID=260671 RepID=A0AAJ0HIQ7_9PEZI|nr:hypothetical protein B0T25DRAFT_208526 [Lasiosphaeria hispida]
MPLVPPQPILSSVVLTVQGLLSANDIARTTTDLPWQSPPQNAHHYSNPHHNARKPCQTPAPRETLDPLATKQRQQPQVTSSSHRHMPYFCRIAHT